jgi:rod shape-determining protein MreD
VTPQRALFGVLAVITALMLQLTVIEPLPLPGAAPDLLLLLVIAFSLAEGQLSGALTGFGAGLLADLLSVHELGRLALAYALAGYLAGAFSDESERSAVLPFAVVAMSALAALGAFTAEGILLGDHRITLHAVARAALSSVPYDVVLTPFVVPLVTALLRRLDVDPLRRL